MPRPTTTAAWQSLRTLALARDPASRQLSMQAAEGCSIVADFSRQHLSDAVMQALYALAQVQGVEAAREAQFAGQKINVTEQQPVLHTALRDSLPLLVEGADVNLLVQRELDKMHRFVDGIRSGLIRSITEEAFTDVVNIGIGGSSLGPRLACEALAAFTDGPRVHFVSNVDGAQLVDTLKGLNPATTLILVTSKTFTTDETMTNARSAQQWLDEKLGTESGVPASVLHLAAITASPAEALRQGYREERIFEFWPWVGGRFSLWSTVGLPVAIAVGFSRFQEMLDGARAMDKHFRTAPLTQNLPVMLALVGIWNRNFLNVASLALLPYSHRLRNFSKYAQQLEMESNGKSVDREGQPINYATCPIIFGEAGTDGQHSFHQLLHQGSDVVAADIILVAADESKLTHHHDKLLANGVAQADALWFGRSVAASFDTHRSYVGGKPVTLLVLPTLNAYYLGALIALYEHKVMVQGAIWNINSYDQWGVDLGKKIATSLLPLFAPHATPTTADVAHLSTLLPLIRRLRDADCQT